jgi:hypothetical protein
MKRLFVLVALLAALPLTGCVATSDYMTRSTAASPTPAPDKALVVFMRPSNYGGGIQASVYDATGPGEEFIGIVSANTKVAWQAEPGKHLFMVIGENADFVNATLDPGKTYYILVSPRMGVWKARFSLLPIHDDPAAKYSLRSDDFREWQAGTYFVEKSPAAETWYREHAASVAEKRADYMDRWKTSSPEQQAELTVLPGDGV